MDIWPNSQELAGTIRALVGLLDDPVDMAKMVLCVSETGVTGDDGAGGRVVPIAADLGNREQAGAGGSNGSTCAGAGMVGTQNVTACEVAAVPPYYDDVEVLLETYVLHFEDCASEVRKLQRKIETTHNSLEVIQSHRRNTLIETELNVTVASVAIAFAMLGPSLFGMNLIHGYEDAGPTMFWAVAAGCAGCGLGIATLTRAYVRSRLQVVPAFAAGRQGVGRAAAALELHDAVLALLDDKGEGDGATLDRDEFQRLVQTMDREADGAALFALFDHDGNGQLDHNDVVNYICTKYRSV